MKEQPVLETRRLVLRPLMAKDDLSVRELANDPQIAGMSLWYMRGAGRKVCRYWIKCRCNPGHTGVPPVSLPGLTGLTP